MRNEIILKVPTRQIAFLTKIIEGYDNLGVVSTLNPAEGIVKILVTPDTEMIMRNILERLPFDLKEIERS